MFRVLNPNTGDDIVPIAMNNIFVSITDFGQITLLREIIVSPGQHHWEWMVINSNKPVDISDIGNRFSSFDNAINRSINDPYCTVYESSHFNEIIRNWDNLVYVDVITTIYKAEKL
jgi:hypothetical protein